MKQSFQKGTPFNEKTTAEKIWYIVTWVLRIGVLLFLAYRIYLWATTGQYIPLPLIAGLVMIVFVGIPNIISIRNSNQGSDEERKKFNKVFWRSLLLSIVIVFCIIVISVLSAING